MTSLHLLPHTAAVDGVQRAVLDFSRGLAARGEPPRVLPLAGGDNLEAWRQVATVDPPAPYLRCSPRQPAQMARAALAAVRLDGDFEVVVVHRLDLLNTGAIFAARVRRPLVFHAHNGPPDWLRWGDLKRVFGSRRVSRLVVASEFMRSEWGPVVGQVPIEVIPLPIDTRHFAVPSPSRRAAARGALGVRDGEFVATYIGRLEEPKGPHVLLGAARRVHEEGNRIRVIVQGAAGHAIPPTMARRYRERCAAAAGDCPVTWVPAGPDVRDAVYAADVCAVPSIWAEPSGLTVAEAMATGTPLVASAVGGIPEQLPSDLPQALSVPADDTVALAAALDRLRRCPPTHSERQALREHVESSRDLAILTERYRNALDR